MIKILGLIVITILLGMTVSNSHALQYIPYDTWAFSKNPTVCLIKTGYQFDIIQNDTLNAIADWNQEFSKYTMGGNWNVNYKTIETSFDKTCDVTIVPDFNTDTEDYAVQEFVAGSTHCDTVITQTCTITLFLKHEDLPTLTNTIEHELGHTFGLGHATGDNVNDFAAVLMSNDIMIYKVTKFHHITQADVLALVHLYGFGGWHHIYKIPDRFSFDTGIRALCKQMTSSTINCVPNHG